MRREEDLLFHIVDVARSDLNMLAGAMYRVTKCARTIAISS